MMIFDPGAGEPTHWYVCFCHRAATAWMERLPIGRYKHVRAFGCVAAVNTWVFFDSAFDRTTVKIARGEAARQLMAEWLTDSDIVRMAMVRRKTMRPRLGGWCVPAVKHLLGISSGALRPDALWRDCLRLGGEVIHANASAVDTSAAPQSARCAG